MMPMMGMIVVVCVTLGFAMSEAKTVIIYLHTKEMPVSTAILSVEAAGHPISYINKRMNTGSENIEAVMRRRRTLFAGFVARLKDTSSRSA